MNASHKPLLLFVDEDRITSGYYCELLRGSFSVVYCDSAEQAEQFLRTAQPFAGFIFDVMMPSPESDTDNQTDDGLKTGVWLLQKARADYPEVPVFILTNKDRHDVQADVEEYPPIWVVNKLDYPPEALEELVRANT